MKISRPHLFAAVVFATVSFVIGSCGFTQGKKDAEAVLVRHFQILTTNGFETATADYAPLFFQKTTKEEWTKGLAGLNRKLGTYQSHTVTNWRVFKKAGTAGASAVSLAIHSPLLFLRSPESKGKTYGFPLRREANDRRSGALHWKIRQ